MSIQPFTIAIPQADQDDLHERLAHTRWPNQLPNIGWSRGVPLDSLKDFVSYWHTSYDWRKLVHRHRCHCRELSLRGHA